MQGNYEVVHGDITTLDASQNIVLVPHVCNTIGAWGGGVSGPIGNTWPKSKEAFKEVCNTMKGVDTKMLLGNCMIVKGGNNVMVANMIAQDGINGKTPDPNRPPIRYGALSQCMMKVREQILSFQNMLGKKIIINAPRFGSDLAGGNWTVIEQMIKEIWCDHGIDVVVWEYP